MRVAEQSNGGSVMMVLMSVGLISAGCKLGLFGLRRILSVVSPRVFGDFLASDALASDFPTFWPTRLSGYRPVQRLPGQRLSGQPLGCEPRGAALRHSGAAARGQRRNLSVRLGEVTVVFNSWRLDPTTTGQAPRRRTRRPESPRRESTGPAGLHRPPSPIQEELFFATFSTS